MLSAFYALKLLNIENVLCLFPTVRFTERLAELTETTTLKRTKLVDLQRKLKEVQLEHRRQCQPIKYEEEQKALNAERGQKAMASGGVGVDGIKCAENENERNHNSHRGKV